MKTTIITIIWGCSLLSVSPYLYILAFSYRHWGMGEWAAFIFFLRCECKWLVVFLCLPCDKLVTCPEYSQPLGQGQLRWNQKHE